MWGNLCCIFNFFISLYRFHRLKFFHHSKTLLTTFFFLFTLVILQIFCAIYPNDHIINLFFFFHLFFWVFSFYLSKWINKLLLILICNTSNGKGFVYISFFYFYFLSLVDCWIWELFYERMNWGDWNLRRKGKRLWCHVLSFVLNDSWRFLSCNWLVRWGKWWPRTCFWPGFWRFSRHGGFF